VATVGSVETLTELSEGRLAELRRTHRFFWLDLERPEQREVDRLVDLIGLDPQAAARALRFGQSPHLRRFDGVETLVFYGADPAGANGAQLVEVHLLVSGDWVVTLRLLACPALDDLRSSFAHMRPAEEAVVARILQALADSFNDLLDPLDERIVDIETEAAGALRNVKPAPALRAEILQDRRGLLNALRIARRQRDYMGWALEDLSSLPGLQRAPRQDLDDVSGLMMRVADQVDGALDRLSDALDLLNSTVANRLNEAMERLTVVATIFLPLTVVTSFFGMNFKWLTDHIESLGTFLVLGLGLCVGSGVVVWLWVRSRLERGLED
jgi:magnesium transporter